ncbi:MAG: glycine/D-amino acid oxidase-like deaminating enzyme [Saprospiraceae bacterium]|jgi:glycine/D-amino acid oxidase-like deaminating enzyme
MNLSFWENSTFFAEVDAAIIGSGLVGLNAALTLKSLQPNWKIIVLEKGILPSGASTKNAGFACFGSPSELLDDLEYQSEDTVFDLVQQRWEGLRRLLDTVGDINLEFEQYGGHELFMEKDVDLYKKCVAALPYLNENLKKIIPINRNYKVVKRDIFGFNGLNRQIKIQAEGQINTGKMMQRLIEIATEKGIKIYNGITVENIEDYQTHVEIQTQNDWKIKAQKVIVATNGFTEKLLPNLQVTPARNQVLITKPINNLKIEGTFHLDKGYYYFRNVGNRVLFGGGRNLDLEGETTSNFGTTDLVQQNLISIFKEHILPNQDFEIEQWWSGILGVGHVKKPIVQNVSPNVTVAVRLGGMGVAIGSLIGEEGAKTCLA